MQIAVLSGKGGTGKTFVSVNLACVADNSVYADCDVEEPNGHLFLKPDNIQKQGVSVSVPIWNVDKCTGCRKCVDFCKYNALAYIKDKLYIFNEICHSCGGCVILCPEKAITEQQREIGKIERGISDNVKVCSGCLNTGEVSGVPIIKSILKSLSSDDNTIIDCPPGSACIVMESIRNADYCVLVAEPTIFGVHNLNMIFELVKLFKKPFGAVLNKCFEGENPAENYCIENNIPILTKLSYSDELAKLNSKGLIAVRENGKYNKQFRQLFSAIKRGAIE